MGLFGRSPNQKILNSFVYGKIIDPRTDEIKLTRIVSCQGDASNEFLSKYLAFIRTKHSEARHLEFIQSCATMLSEYTKNLDCDFNTEDYIFFMSNGFTMAAVEIKYFEIAKPNKMAGCTLGAMADYYNLNVINAGSNFISFDLAIHAMLSGYHLARANYNTNSPSSQN